MSARITLHEFVGNGSNNAPALKFPGFATKTATFTADRNCYMRVQAVSADVTLTSGGVAHVVTSGSTEIFGVDKDTLVVVS